MRSHGGKNLLLLFFAASCLSLAWAVNRYYGTYAVYGTGDTILTTFHAHNGPGPAEPNRKWHVECMDGEAMIGIGDFVDDFNKFATCWCKFLFPLKPPTNGLYPYYPNCFAQNFTYQYHCYNPKYHDATIHTMVTGFWDNDFQWWQMRDGLDYSQPYKCCKTPLGYYIDYLSCYYFPTKDIYGEYYDNNNMLMVTCSTGYVMTGIGKKRDIFEHLMHIAFIQCCRIGEGPVASFRPPPKTYSYEQYENTGNYPYRPTGAYAAQYQGRSLKAQGVPRNFLGYDNNHTQELQQTHIPMGGPMMFPTLSSLDHEEDLDAHYR